jgi:hypothetical protein
MIVLKNMSPTIHVGVVVHYTSILRSWRGTSEGFLRLVLFQCPLFWALIHPLRWNQASWVKNVSSESRTPSCTARKNQLLEYILFYMAVDVSFQPLSTLLFSKPVHVELIMPGICKANVLIWLQFYEAFSWLTQHFVLCISYVRRNQFKRFFDQFRNHWWSWNLDTRILMVKPFLHDLWYLFFT